MSALGLLGSDDTALKLTPLVRAWPGESQHQRAVFGLECLRAIGTDVALMQLNGIAQKVSFKGLKAKARESSWRRSPRSQPLAHRAGRPDRARLRPR